MRDAPITTAPEARWPTISIAELAEVVTKGTTPTSVGHQFTEDGVNFVKVEAISPNGAFVLSKFAKVSKQCHDTLRRSQLQAGDILFSIAGALGRTAIVSPEILPANTNQAVGIIRLRQDAPVERRFLLHALSPSLMLDQIEAQRGGVAQQNLSLAQIKAMRVPLPPLEEQKRIVAVLDQAFAALDRARAHAEANLANSAELFDAELNEVFGQPPANWHQCRLGDVCSKIGSGATPRGGADAYKSEGVALIRSLNVHDRDFRTAKLAFIDDEQATKLSNVIVEEDDVLFNITGASIARCSMVENHILPARVNQHVAILRPDATRLLPSFLTFFMTASDQKKQLLETGAEGGATRQAITKTQLQSLPVRFPADVEAQKALVEKLRISEFRCRNAAANYVKQLDDNSYLRQSLLQKAFSGQLTA